MYATGWVFPIFILGNLLGTLIFAIGLLRSRAVPLWAAISIMSWPPLRVAGAVYLWWRVLEVVGAQCLLKRSRVCRGGGCGAASAEPGRHP